CPCRKVYPAEIEFQNYDVPRSIVAPHRGPAVCEAAGLAAGCRMAELPGDIAPPEPGDGRPDLTGVFDYAPSAAQTLMREYAEGKQKVGVGGAGTARAER